MAVKVTAQVFGGEAKVLDGVSTISEIKQKLAVPNHTATINGEAATDSDEVSDYDFVSLAPAVKGA
jgi:hypothetical protein